MRRLIVGVVLGGVLLIAPHRALAIDYAEPAVPEEFGGPGPAVAPDDRTGAAEVSPQTVPDDPPFIPHNTWDNHKGGCALWDWDTC
jgi:hypothetical protein